MKNVLFNFAITFITIFMFTSITYAKESNIKKVIGQELYVPIYSHIMTNNKFKMDLLATVSIRNTSFKHPIKLEKVAYYNSSGKFIRNEIKEPIVIPTMGSKYFTIQVNDTVGGVGANYIIIWSSEKELTPPVVESVMFGSIGATGLSFARDASVIKEFTKDWPFI